MNQDLSSHPFIPAIRAKAIALYARTVQLVSGVFPLTPLDLAELIISPATEELWAEHTIVKTALEHFYSTLPLFEGCQSWRSQPPLVDVELFAIHTMTKVAQMILQKKRAPKDSLLAAMDVSAMIRHLNDVDYQYLHPITSVRSCIVAIDPY